MSDEKAKNDKQYQSEFSFSFSGLADKVGEMLEGVGGEPTDSSYSALRDGVSKARVRLDAGPGLFTVTADADPAELISVDARHMGRLVFAISDKDGERTVRLEPEGSFRGVFNLGSKRKSLYCNVALNPDVPTDLKMESSVGGANIDLSGMILTAFTMDGGVGPVTVVLPNSADGYKTAIESGIGPVSVRLPAENPGKISVEGGVGPMTVHIPEDANLNLSLEGGIGPVSVYIAPGTALRVKREKGLGPFDLPSELIKVSSDTFQTEGFDLAARSVTLKAEGGLGPVRIKWHDAAEEAAKPKEKAKPKHEDDADMI